MSTPVAVFPGFSANVPKLIPQVVARTESLFERYEEPVSLVGWSLGGVLAREVARERPGVDSTTGFLIGCYSICL